jgi:HD superfamily phosphodiesterase
MNLEQNIESAEKKYIQVLKEFFIEKWGETQFFSHNLNHHVRVWNYAKELLLCHNKEITKYTSDFCKKLLIACYLHDIGMSVNPGIKHGIQSNELCRTFLTRNNLKESDFTEVLDAVEYHDDKEYKTRGSNNNEILKFLSAADDLDAFGYIGIYRYLEIYIARDIRPEVIGYEIRKNALKRFQNFELNFGNFPGLIERHRKRFLILDDFFAGYNNEAGL